MPLSLLQQKNISSYWSLTGIDIGSDESETQFSLYSTIPQFRTLPTPQVRPDKIGRDFYQLSLTCKDYLFYHRTIVYNMPPVDSFGTLDSYISSVLDDLKVSPDLPIKKDNYPPYQTLYKWSADAEIDTVVSLISVNLYYNTENPVEDTMPVDASFEILFSDASNVMKGTVFARSMLSQLIYDKFQLWPDQCARDQNKK